MRTLPRTTDLPGKFAATLASHKSPIRTKFQIAPSQMYVSGLNHKVNTFDQILFFPIIVISFYSANAQNIYKEAYLFLGLAVFFLYITLH